VWTRVCSVGDVEEDDVCRFEVGGLPLAVYNLAGKFYATTALCTHEQADLGSGYLCDGIIECPKHNARFDVATGKCLRRPAKVDLKTYAVKVEGDSLFVDVEAS